MAKQTQLIFYLSLIAGFVDTAGFIALSGIFTAHITGNLVLAGASVAHFEKSDEVFSKLILIPVFIFGVILTARVIKLLHSDTRMKLKFLLGVQALLLLLFSLSGSALVADWIGTHLIIGIILKASLAVLAMAVQNTYMKMLLPNIIPTTIMTGNLTNFAVEAENFLSTFSIRKSIHLTATANALLGFLIGCVGGAFGVIEIGLFSILVPVLILIVLAYAIKL